MPKFFLPLLVLTFLFSAAGDCFGQKNIQPEKNAKTAIAENANDAEFYSVAALEADFKQSAVVADVNILGFELVDQIGQGGCERNAGIGYCLYRARAQVKAIYKGRVKTKIFAFYKVTEAAYPYKDRMLGRHVVFLNWSENYPDRKRSLGTIENSTRDLKHNIRAKLRKIAENKKR